jgi:hypothetical protein
VSANCLAAMTGASTQQRPKQRHVRSGTAIAGAPMRQRTALPRRQGIISTAGRNYGMSPDGTLTVAESRGIGHFDLGGGAVGLVAERGNANGDHRGD